MRLSRSMNVNGPSWNLGTNVSGCTGQNRQLLSLLVRPNLKACD